MFRSYLNRTIYTCPMSTVVKISVVSIIEFNFNIIGTINNFVQAFFHALDAITYSSI